MNSGSTYLSEAHRRACEEWDRNLARKLTDDYLGSFLMHFSNGKSRSELPNPLLCPQPDFLVVEAKARDWPCEETNRGWTVKLPAHVQILSPLPTTMPNAKPKPPKKDRRRSQAEP